MHACIAGDFLLKNLLSRIQEPSFCNDSDIRVVLDLATSSRLHKIRTFILSTRRDCFSMLGHHKKFS